MFLCLLGTKHHCWTEILSFCFLAVAGFIVTSRGTKIKITAGFHLFWEEKKNILKYPTNALLTCSKDNSLILQMSQCCSLAAKR